MKRVVVAGCGLAGLKAAIELHKLLKNKVEILGVDRSETFNFAPFIHRVAAATIEANKTTFFLRDFFREKGYEFFKGEVAGIKLGDKKLVTDKQSIDYDYLILALGCETSFYGVPGAKENCFEFKTFNDAMELSEHIARMFFNARSVEDREERDAMLRFVVCGGGATGLELATELSYYVNNLSRRYKGLRGELVLVEAMPRVLPGLPKEMAAYAESALGKLGIKLFCREPIVEVGEDFVELRNGERIYSKTIVWCAGVKPPELLKRSGLKLNERGYVEVNRFLQAKLNGEVEEAVYSAGDVVNFLRETGKPLLKLGRHAVDQGKVAARNIYADISGKRKVPYNPRTEATVISLGRKDAIGFYGDKILRGRTALWLKYWVENRYLKGYMV